MFQSTQHIFNKNKATCFGYKRIAVIRPELQDAKKGFFFTSNWVRDLKIYSKNVHMILKNVRAQNVQKLSFEGIKR
jgi:hypothetical protein